MLVLLLLPSLTNPLPPIMILKKVTSPVAMRPFQRFWKRQIVSIFIFMRDAIVQLCCSVFFYKAFLTDPWSRSWDPNSIAKVCVRNVLEITWRRCYNVSRDSCGSLGPDVRLERAATSVRPQKINGGWSKNWHPTSSDYQVGSSANTWT